MRAARCTPSPTYLSSLSAGLPGVNPHAHSKLRPVRPLVLGERTLPVDGCGHGVLGPPEGDEEGVALRVDLMSAVGCEGLAQQSLMLRERLSVEPAQTLQQARRSLDVREQEADSPGGPLP